MQDPRDGLVIKASTFRLPKLLLPRAQLQVCTPAEPVIHTVLARTHVALLSLGLALVLLGSAPAIAVGRVVGHAGRRDGRRAERRLGRRAGLRDWRL